MANLFDSAIRVIKHNWSKSRMKKQADVHTSCQKKEISLLL